LIGRTLSKQFATFLLFLAPATAEALNLSDLILDMEVTYNRLTSYSCIAEETISTEPDSGLKYQYLFRKPGEIRVKILSGPKKGELLVYRDGKVRVKKAIGLPVPTLTYPVQDPNVTLFLNGDITTTGIGPVIERIKEYIKKGRFFPAKGRRNSPELCLVLKPRNREPFPGISEEKIWIDIRLKLPVRHVQYLKGKDYKSTRFKNLKVNIKQEGRNF